MTLAVHPMMPEDVPSLVSLINAIIAAGDTTAYETPFDAQSFAAEFLSGEDVVLSLVAHHSDHGPVGFQVLVSYAKGEVETLGIGSFADQSLPIKGIGRAMMAETKSRARALGCRQINAKIRSDNVPGLAYYTGQGFERYDILPAVPLADGTPVDRVLTRFVF